MNKKDLIELDKDQILKSNNKKGGSSLLTFALIRNDISDLVHLQGLFVDSYIKLKKGENSELGQYAGRRIYFIRLFLSHYYEFLVFLDKRKEQINNDLELQLILKNLNKGNLKIWDKFNSIASKIESKDEKVNDSVEYKVAILSKYIREGLTFHYWHASSHLYNGFKKAFIEDVKNLYNTYPQVTELNDLDKNRSYYVDLSIQRYLEANVELKKDLFSFEEEIINTLAEVNLILNKILNKYHSNIKLK